jgi:4,5-dihydroxyphthalate decarboxylase
MQDLQLSYAGRIYDRTLALKLGHVKPEGIELRYSDLRVSDIFWRMARYADFDVAEMSLSTFILTREKRTTDLIAIPVFPSRAFRHNMVFVNTKAGIVQPSDLRGKRVGSPSTR